MNQEPKIYLARAGRSGEDEDRALEHNIAIVGFQEVPPLVTAKDYRGRPRDRHKSLTRRKAPYSGQLRWSTLGVHGGNAGG